MISYELTFRPPRFSFLKVRPATSSSWWVRSSMCPSPTWYRSHPIWCHLRNWWGLSMTSKAGMRMRVEWSLISWIKAQAQKNLFTNRNWEWLPSVSFDWLGLRFRLLWCLTVSYHRAKANLWFSSRIINKKWTHLASSAYFTLTYVCDHISPAGILRKINCNPNSLPFSSLPCSVLRASPNACARLRWCLEHKTKWYQLPQWHCWPSWHLSAQHALARRNAWIFRAACSFLAAWIISKPTTNLVK